MFCRILHIPVLLGPLAAALLLKDLMSLLDGVDGDVRPELVLLADLDVAVEYLKHGF